jgi:hypothetical protein
MSNRTNRPVPRLTIWRLLGQGSTNETLDNFGWAKLPACDGRSPIAFDDECVESMPYGHHQIGMFT